MKKNILIVEDDPFSQDFYKFILERVGYNSKIVEDGDVLLKILNEETIDLIIMDINLKNTYLNGKKIDGIQLSQLIKTNSKISNIPILLVTAYSNNVPGKDLLAESLSEEIITKPIVDLNQLLEKINKLTEHI